MIPALNRLGVFFTSCWTHLYFENCFLEFLACYCLTCNFPKWLLFECTPAMLLNLFLWSMLNKRYNLKWFKFRKKYLFKILLSIGRIIHKLIGTKENFFHTTQESNYCLHWHESKKRNIFRKSYFQFLANYSLQWGTN